MNALKRALYLEATVWAVTGLALSIDPRLIAVSAALIAPAPLASLRAFGLRAAESRHPVPAGAETVAAERA